MLGWILSRAKTFVSQSGQFWVNIRELELTLRLQLQKKVISLLGQRYFWFWEKVVLGKICVNQVS